MLVRRVSQGVQPFMCEMSGLSLVHASMLCALRTNSPMLAGDSCHIPEPYSLMRRVLCAGFSLGAALATLCGPWAKATFPNVSHLL